MLAREGVAPFTSIPLAGAGGGHGKPDRLGDYLRKSPRGPAGRTLQCGQAREGSCSATAVDNEAGKDPAVGHGALAAPYEHAVRVCPHLTSAVSSLSFLLVAGYEKPELPEKPRLRKPSSTFRGLDVFGSPLSLPIRL